MFETARFKVHNPSRHKRAMLRYALTHYHLTLKAFLERALAEPDLVNKISVPDKKGRMRVNSYALSRLLYTIAPKGWALAPLRDYLIGDAGAMLMSHFRKLQKGRHESNPPTLPGLDPPTETEIESAYQEFATTIDFPLKPKQTDLIVEAQKDGHPRVVRRLSNIYRNWASSRAAGQLLRKTESNLPRPIEFTRPEFERGYILAQKGTNYYLLIRLFAKGHRYWSQKKLDDGYINCRTQDAIGGRNYPGVILPLELGREYHEAEYIRHGRPQSAKLLVKRSDDGNETYYVHVAFEFSPEAVPVDTYLGIDRGAVKIGAGTVISHSGEVVATGVQLEGKAFAAEMDRLRRKIAELQRRGLQRHRLLRLRGRKADALIGEYANRVVEAALRHHSQIVLENVQATAMARFLSQSQFQKLHFAVSYKAERVGLPAPIDVPAAYTSQTCARCGHKAAENRPRRDAEGRALQDVFRCVSCGYQANADDNASEVIALRGLHQQLNGGKFQRFDTFQTWLIKLRGRDSASASGG
ncbi:MAG: transposase [Acidobacteria bacterium]|nr:transposase [Acidobacteriota bacterium]